MSDPRAPIPGIAALATARIVSGAAFSVPQVKVLNGVHDPQLPLCLKSDPLTTGAPEAPPMIIKKHAPYLRGVMLSAKVPSMQLDHSPNFGISGGDGN
jgi:hypothetical protein